VVPLKRALAASGPAVHIAELVPQRAGLQFLHGTVVPQDLDPAVVRKLHRDNIVIKL